MKYKIGIAAVILTLYLKLDDYIKLYSFIAIFFLNFIEASIAEVRIAWEVNHGRGRKESNLLLILVRCPDLYST